MVERFSQRVGVARLVYCERMKHIDIKLHFVREVIVQRFVNVMKVLIDHSYSNMITKCLSNNKSSLFGFNPIDW